MMRFSLLALLLGIVFGLASAAPKHHGSGCCTHDYKSCITWCGDSKNDCLTCSNPDVGWIPNGVPADSTCGERWSGCGANNNSGHSGCCDGLTCQAQSEYYSACSPGESTPTTPPNPTNPPVPDPTEAPQPLPTTPPVPDPTEAPQPLPTTPPVPDPTKAPQPLPTTPPVPDPTEAPQPLPTTPPVPDPTEAPTNGNGNGCCSLDYKNCVSWCGPSKSSCATCANTDVVWLPNGPNVGTCGSRWSGCSADNNGNNSGCCNGLTCQWRGGGNGYFACLVDDSNPTPPQPNPTPVTPTAAPVVTPTTAPMPTTPFSGELLSTDNGLNAWEVYEGLDSITYKKSPANPPNYAVVASGGAAGDGTEVVSEGQAYGLFITGTVLASWDTHAGQVFSNEDRDEKRAKVLKSFEGYYNFWKDMCKNSSNNSANCQSGGNYCKSGSNSYVCLPDWKHSKNGGSIATGPAPDGDEDAIVGIILAVKAVENDNPKPSWYDEARKWADASASALFKFEVDKSKGDFRLMKLGSCWGGWEGSGNNPSYHSPGSYRVMKDYQKSFPNSDRVGYSVVSQSEWTKLIDTSHEVLRAVQCSNDGALVPNWATIGVSNDGKIVHSGGTFSGSGTPQYEYGSEAARTSFRVALDAALHPEMSSEWSPYLSHYNYRMDETFNNGSFSDNAFPSCITPQTNQNINMFNDWQSNAFIYGPTFTTLIAASSDITNRVAMIDAAGYKLGALPESYYSRSWAMISALMLNGAMESAGNTLKG